MSAAAYLTLAAAAEAEIKEKGSRFIAYAYPVRSAEEVKRYVDAQREAHHKARHWCYAYRLGTDGNQFRANDDGEPSGSAGRPILGQIDSFGLTDTLVVVVRYFGGTLLGVPGLIQAYKGSTAAALQQAQIVEKNIEKTLYLRCGYPHLNDAIRIAQRYQAEVAAQDLQLDCRLTVRVPLAQAEAAEAAWRQTRQIEVRDAPFAD
ncbi:YigZ family protein [Neisseria leonii]|uniref:IMPACT family protein n=1 Tax=Neisseria leonii TaxID=2995413 RepID=A0A9X4E284_9NEIS|nr:YigZ family protein [Neisseria sp. 51.81]MDD9328220.1 IMPACT family protein [Neisseria sp. 51.81]